MGRREEIWEGRRKIVRKVEKQEGRREKYKGSRQNSMEGGKIGRKEKK